VAETSTFQSCPLKIEFLWDFVPWIVMEVKYILILERSTRKRRVLINYYVIMLINFQTILTIRFPLLETYIFIILNCHIDKKIEFIFRKLFYRFAFAIEH